MRWGDIIQDAENDKTSLKSVVISRDKKKNTVSVVGMTPEGKRIVIQTWHEKAQEEAYSLEKEIKTGKNEKYAIVTQESKKNKKPLSTQGAYDKAESPEYCRYNPPGTNYKKGTSARKGMVG